MHIYTIAEFELLAEGGKHIFLLINVCIMTKIAQARKYCYHIF